MKLLLTSSGISNTSIHDALVDLLGNPIAESSALCIPTGVQPFPADLRTSTSSSAEQPSARCAAWVGSRWEC
jgi:dipeptidase E